MKVLVTGANGHLGYNLVKALLAAGHGVRGSIRTLADEAAVARLKALGPVEVVAAQLESQASLREAADGMDALAHTAAIYQLYAPGREREIVSASVDGVERALRAAAEAGLRRVVLTSSVTALPMVAPGSPPVTEADWASDLRVPYFRGKTLAERRAFELAGELGLDLASVLPGAFAGPGFHRPTPTIELFAAIMKGAMELAAPPIAYPYVDVRDVAEAHVLALASGKTGRFIAIGEPIPTLAEICRLMHAIDPKIAAPRLTLPGFIMPVLPWLDGLQSLIGGTARTLTPEMAATMRGRTFAISSARIRRELGWEPRIPLRQSLADTIAAIRAQGAAGNAGG